MIILRFKIESKVYSARARGLQRSISEVKTSKEWSRANHFSFLTKQS